MEVILYRVYSVESLIKDPPRRGQPPNKGQVPFPIAFSIALTSKKGMTSLRRTKWLISKCPLLGGSTGTFRLSFVERFILFQSVLLSEGSTVIFLCTYPHLAWEDLA